MKNEDAVYTSGYYGSTPSWQHEYGSFGSWEPGNASGITQRGVRKLNSGAWMNAARTKSLGLRVRAIQTARFGHSPRIRMVWAGFRPMGKPDWLVGFGCCWCRIPQRLANC